MSLSGIVYHSHNNSCYELWIFFPIQMPEHLYRLPAEAFSKKDQGLEVVMVLAEI